MYQQIKDTLKRVAPTYDPGTKVGEIKTPYLVLRDMGVDPNARAAGRLGQHIYEVIVLAPLNGQDALRSLCKQVREKLSGLPRLKYTGEAAPTGLEEQYLGAATSLVYRMPKIIQ